MVFLIIGNTLGSNMSFLLLVRNQTWDWSEFYRNSDIFLSSQTILEIDANALPTDPGIVSYFWNICWSHV